jgi:formate hydrogenlyase transcriptional activator
MTQSSRLRELVRRLKLSIERAPFLYRHNIRRRLTICFVFVIALMLLGTGVFLWQLHSIGTQVERLNGVNTELVEVLHVHTDLVNVYEEMGVLARSEDSARLIKETNTLRADLARDAQRTDAAFNKLPSELKVDQTVLPTLESIERTLPSHLDAITASATSGEWGDVRFRIERQVQPLESLSSELVKDVAKEVDLQRAQTASSIARAERHMFLALVLTGFLTFLIASGLGVAVTNSITRPLERLVEGSKALAGGDFQHRVIVSGDDELAQLSHSFNVTTVKLGSLYETLRSREADLLEAQRISHTGSWKHDVSSGLVTVSPEVFRIFGVKPDEEMSTTEFWLKSNHPEDQKRIRELFERSEIEKTDYVADYRIVLPDGSIKHIHAVGHPVLTESGELVEFVGTAMDITERKQAEDKVREQEIELRQILDAAPQHLSVLRGDGSHLYINQSSLDFLGLTLEEWQKGDIREFVHPDDRERVTRERKQALSSGSPLEIEMRMRRHDGEYRWYFLHYKPLKDYLGRITRWVVPALDIDDRKRSEERLQHENLVLREQIDQAFMFEEIVGSSAALQTVLSSIVKVAPTDSTVLITGETGTGKELIARAIHKHSQRSGQAFISVNCASIPSSLIASELFGHEKGAFTGAVQRRQGRFELAHSGTIFLDEVGDLPAETQVTLLRVLQERQFERVGGNRVLTTDVRVIAATNRDLAAAIAAGTFRSDLFYRLNVFPIEVPPLRKRKEDIPMLVEYFVKRYAEKAGKQIRKIDTNTLELCQAYSWPGNIRELQNIVERSVILSSNDTFRIEEAWLASPEPARQEFSRHLPDTLQNQEREIIEAALAECNGKVAGPKGAAAKLGIPRSTLESKITQLKIKKHKFYL